MSIEKTLAERGGRYGDFSDHAKIAQDLQKVMHNARRASPVVGHPDAFKVGSWEVLSDVQRQALTVIADKIARILSGDPNYSDNWHDIQGYAKLAEDRLPQAAPDMFADEPATSIDDESPRMQAIGQNGNGGEHYSESAWIDWAGGSCPVDKGVKVEVRYRDRQEWHYDSGLPAWRYYWLHGGVRGDIVAYRPVTP